LHWIALRSDVNLHPSYPQVVNLHYMLSKTVVKARPSVLGGYKKELDLSAHQKKRMKQIKKMAQVGGGLAVENAEH